MSDPKKNEQQVPGTEESHSPTRDEAELSDEALESVAGGCEIGCSVSPDSQWPETTIVPTLPTF